MLLRPGAQVKSSSEDSHSYRIRIVSLEQGHLTYWITKTCSTLTVDSRAAYFTQSDYSLNGFMKTIVHWAKKKSELSLLLNWVVRGLIKCN